MSESARIDVPADGRVRACPIGLRANLEIVNDHPDPSLEATTHNNLGTLYYSTGAFQKALIEFQTSLDMYRDQGNVPETAARYYSIGTVYQRMGHLETTLSYYQRARELQEEVETQRTSSTPCWGSVGSMCSEARRGWRWSRSSGARAQPRFRFQATPGGRAPQDGSPPSRARPTRGGARPLEEGLAMASEIQQPLAGIGATSHRASAKLELGRTDEALATLDEKRAMSTRRQETGAIWRTYYYQMAQIDRRRASSTPRADGSSRRSK